MYEIRKAVNLMWSLEKPLRYRISSWRQLPRCKSNNNPDLVIRVSDFYNNTDLRGFRILVDHPSFGCVFCCVLEARGTMITENEEYGVVELSADEILAELEKFGFFIEYTPQTKLSGNQIQYLMTLKNLGYDKIRILSIGDGSPTPTFSPRVVAFQVSKLGDWLNNAYCPSNKEFIDALDKGYACNLTAVSQTKNYRWDWLKDFVGDIDDIIRDNANPMIEFDPPTPTPPDDDGE